MHVIEPDVRVSIRSNMPVLKPSLDEAIDRLWCNAQARLGGALFNGRVFCADQIGARLIEGHWTEFRRLVAQFEEPAMFGPLRIRALAVNGAVLGPDGAIIGRRPEHAIYQAGLWQLAPAGSIDPSATRPDGLIDVMTQVATELREELGIPFSAIESATPIGLVEHAVSHVCDLGIAMTTSLEKEAIRTAHATLGDGEYGTLKIVGRAQIAGFAATAGNSLAPQSRLFLERIGWLET